MRRSSILDWSERNCLRFGVEVEKKRAESTESPQHRASSNTIAIPTRANAVRVVIHSDGAHAGAGLDVGPRHRSIHEAPEVKRVPVAQRERQRGVRKVLVADGTGKAADRRRADRSRPRVRGGGIRASVLHGVPELNAGGEAVEDQSSHLALKDLHQSFVLAQLLVVPVYGCGELTFE